MIISNFEHLGMTTNFWLCMRHEHDSDKQFSRCEHTNTNAHVKCLLRLQLCTKQWLCLTLVFCNIQARTATNTLCVEEYMSRNAYLIIPEIQLAYSEHECVVCIVGCLLFWGVHMLSSYSSHLHMESILRSIYAEYRSIFFVYPPLQMLLGLSHILLWEGTCDGALKMSSWTTFCLVQFLHWRKTLQLSANETLLNKT